MKKENNIPKNCPIGMEFDDKKGRCVNPNLENLNLKSRSAPNLRFDKTERDN